MGLLWTRQEPRLRMAVLACVQAGALVTRPRAGSLHLTELSQTKQKVGSRPRPRIPAGAQKSQPISLAGSFDAMAARTPVPAIIE